jgi:hypothetical protein
MTYSHLKPQKPSQQYTPRVFGFKLHKPSWQSCSFRQKHPCHLGFRESIVAFKYCCIIDVRIREPGPRCKLLWNCICFPILLLLCNLGSLSLAWSKCVVNMHGFRAFHTKYFPPYVFVSINICGQHGHGFDAPAQKPWRRCRMYFLCPGRCTMVPLRCYVKNSCWWLQKNSCWWLHR